jgi:hypothetical protein
MEGRDQLFLQLVYIFHHSALQGMGKVKNPVTNKIERNLPQAQQAIEMLEMLKEKTTGNLSTELSQNLESTLTDLRLNYIDEMNKESQTK